MTIYEARMILELSDDYDEVILKRQYHVMTVKYHPDNCMVSGISVEVANRKIKEINEANSVLTKYLKDRGTSYSKKSNGTSRKTTGSYYDNINNSFEDFYDFMKQKAYYQNKEANDCDMLKEKILADLRRKLKLNKEGFSSFEKLMKIFEADDIIYAFNIFIEFLRYHINNVFSSKMYFRNEDLNNEYICFINEYEDSLLIMYNEFYDVYMKKYTAVDLEDESLYAWLLNNRNKNRKFSFVGDLTKQIMEDLERLMEFSNKRKHQKFINDMKVILFKYQNYVFYDKLEKKIRKIINKYVEKVEREVEDKNNKRKNLKKVFLLASENVDEEINNLFCDYSEFLNTRRSRIDTLWSKFNKSIDSKYVASDAYVKILLKKLEIEFDMDVFLQLEIDIMKELELLLLDNTFGNETYLNNNNFNLNNNFIKFEKDEFISMKKDKIKKKILNKKKN